ncbi:MAG: endonuclease/exonuclease/phosphatase family protein [Candidatus Sumerlaeia bacterium]|nr:endonuclease/exonuclease/phosphatase family protein [Candidatus Sumerlaeia bacterium]
MSRLPRPGQLLVRTLAAPLLIAAVLLVAAGCTARRLPTDVVERQSQRVRVALFNIELISTAKLEEVDAQGRGANPQLLAATAILQRIQPDILVLNELDHDYDAVAREGAPLERNAWLFHARYLAQGDAPLRFEHAFVEPCNTGILSGRDLDNDGIVATDADRGTRVHGNDSFGYGEYPGQYAMGLLSRYPIERAGARTFQTFRWLDLPGNHIPPDWYSPEALEVFRLSSKSHWDVPIDIDGRTLHVLVSHPTPPVFDGPEDRNGRRNFDEIKFWVHYLADDPALYDDGGRRGGLAKGSPFIIAGDLNASLNSDPIATGEIAIRQLLDHPGIHDPGDLHSSTGALRGRQPGPPLYYERATASWREGFRVDYLLPSPDIRIVDGGVFWPSADEDPEGHAQAEKASDHRLVWLEIEF